MTGIRFLMTKSSRRMYNTCLKPNGHVYQADAIARPCVTIIGRDYSTDRSSRSSNVAMNPSRLSNLHLKKTTYPLLGATHLLNHRSYSTPAGSHGSDGSGLLHKVTEFWNSSVNVASETGDKAKEAFNEVTPHVEKLLDTYPYLQDVIVPVGGTITGTIAAWAILPRIFRRLHKYSTEGPGTFIPVGSLWQAVPYEKSFWGALEVPVKYLITFMAFSQIGVMVAPTTFALQFIAPAWRAATILSVVWFFHRWKTNVITRALVTKSLMGVDRNKLLTVDKFSSVGLFAVGGMALAEACGVPVQSLLTVGGIGGVATAFAARDILGNVLSGLSVQVSQPFSIGDTIKAGSMEGQVIEMGLTTTTLLSAEKFPIVVPNSLFSSQAIVNKSRAGWRAMVVKVPVRIDDFDKIPQISEEIKNMMKSNANVFLDKEQPYCYLSRVERSFAELSLGCNLKQMRKDMLYSAEQDLLLQSVGIIKKHGATLGRTLEG
ncbi:mechanosensitive ion channel protein 1, mitochondrial [Rutidosis leptorrhynchoides]|uniref:mechanosensitive ion channel protein 1, mitochondrial n=1 Tax=Rutidosis leptorrhynchoides TaxID=125765 RepID=UPI003A99A766